jgi:hypothetical protein
MKKIVKYLIIFWISFTALVLSMGLTRHVYLNGPRIKGTPKEIILFLSSFTSNITSNFASLKPMVVRSPMIQDNGFNFSSKRISSKDYLLIISWNDNLGQSAIKLCRIKDGKVIYRWAPEIKKLKGISNSTELLHPFLMNDGSLIVSCGGTFKVDKNSNIIWANYTPSHHSLEPDADGNFWICSYNSSTKNSEKYQILDDAIKKIDPVDGKVLFEKSVFEILMENGYGMGHFFINPQVSTNLTHLDYSHLNEVQPVLEDSRFWEKGDLFLSLRHQNLVLLYRPSTNKIIWSQNGPWLKQHNVSIIDSTRIGIFGNNVLDASFPSEDDQLIDGHNRAYIYDFATNQISTPYDEFFKSSKIKTHYGGRAKIFADGEIFVEESDKGRLLYGNQKEEIWSYIEKIGKDKVSLFNWCRYITEEEFKKFTFVDQNNN